EAEFGAIADASGDIAAAGEIDGLDGEAVAEHDVSSGGIDMEHERVIEGGHGTHDTRAPADAESDGLGDAAAEGCGECEWGREGAEGRAEFFGIGVAVPAEPA